MRPEYVRMLERRSLWLNDSFGALNHLLTAEVAGRGHYGIIAMTLAVIVGDGAKVWLSATRRSNKRRRRGR